LSLAKNITTSYTSQIINILLGFVSSVFLTRILGAAERGEYALYINGLTVATIFLGFGLPSAIIFFVSSNKISVKKLFSFIVVFNIAMTFVIAIVLQILFITGLQNFILPDKFQSTFYEFVFILQFFVALINSSLIAILNGRKYFVTVSIINVVITAIGTTLYILFYYKLINWNGEGFKLIITLSLFVSFLQSIIIIYFYYRYIGIKFSGFLKFKETKSLFTFSLIAYACNGIQFLTYRADIWFVDYYRDISTVGIYSLAVSLAQLLWILPNVIAGILFSYMAGCNREKAIEYTLFFTKLSFFASLIMAIAAFTIFYFFLHIIFGDEFSSAVPLIGILFFGIVPFSTSIIFGSFFAGTGYIHHNLITSILGFCVAIFFYITLIPKYGASGAALASIVSYISCTLYMFFAFTKLTGHKILKIFIINKSDIILLKSVLKKVRT
jgi:O-antigen/teichoic acid export membrane protein